MKANKWSGGVLALLLWAVLALPVARAQQPTQLVAEMQAKFPGEKAVYLDYRTDLTLEAKGDSVLVLARHHQDMLHLDAQSVAYVNDKVYNSHFSRLQKLDARTMVPSGNSYKAVKVTDYKEKFELQSGIFYDDTRSTTWTFPAVAPGARTVTDYTVRHPDPRFLNPFYFGSYVPVRHAELTVTAPRNIKISHRLFHTEGLNISFSKQEKGNTITYRWTADNLPSPPRDSDGPEAAYYLPHLVYFVEEVPSADGQARKVLAGVPELYNLYSGFVSKLDPQESPALRRVVDSLVVGAKTEQDRVQRVYYWVQDNIRYVAFENGMGGFIPRDAGAVYAKRYGDCKDMANLTREMLRMAGVKSYLTWIGTRDLPYRYSELATPGVDNHMITTYEASPGKYVFLDATNKYMPFGMPSAFIQGKEALMAIDGKNCKVVDVPVMSQDRSPVSDVSALTLDDKGGLRGKGSLQLAGYPKVMQSYALDGLDQTEETKYIKSLLERGNNKFFVDKYRVSHLDTRDQPLTIDYEYRLQDYVQKLDDEIYVNLNLERPYAHDRIDADKRRLPRVNEYATQNHSRTELEIPAGYDVEYLPPVAEMNDPVFGFKVKYERQGNKIVQDKQVYINYLMLQPKQFHQWNAVVDKLNAAYRETVILKRKKA
ncbi:DUF3857 domain-containing transglutaminase family protein [Hymenobacter psychrotolerans]|uniref:Transglutaminase-like superfamily protein n=1 Tax=Hymenobacter psychrotolerans DSM 18569 TaxID=1121959 RepID=A0A1M6RJQ7_9BACT|nr:DUF3857 and transglutaminase domain-containing protein [Hymenobacter psychrotolerans]SHK32670.1 Transglutaminase-like superfamily protein [Hymenobacter psychrotolerans DSM 18569]